MRSVTSFNDTWVFSEGFAATQTGRLQTGKPISLPHNAVELPFNYFDEAGVGFAEHTWEALQAQRAAAALFAIAGTEPATSAKPSSVLPASSPQAE